MIADVGLERFIGICSVGLLVVTMLTALFEHRHNLDDTYTARRAHRRLMTEINRHQDER